MQKLSKALLLSATALAGCQSEDSGAGITSSYISVSAGALGAAYVTDWTSLQAAATALRNSAKYTFQNISSVYGYPYSQANSLDHANVEYAHAALPQLTGAGETIAIIDSGFLTTHLEFFGKTITLTTGAGAIGVADHGTTVAATAAGSATSGSSIGVAPGANLHLGVFTNGDFALQQATLQAKAAGAIVQNNSWGSDTEMATATGFSNAFGSEANIYIQALKSFATSGVIVFAASNDQTRTYSDIMSGLPLVVSGIEDSWISAVNAVPFYTGSNITSAQRLSSACLQAAAWCMAADGTVNGATATSNSSYAVGTGTSFSAPQVSGAVALLAQAFPSLTAQDLRARLLASANNGFYTHTGFVNFGGVKHGYNSEFGHGFLDLKAALSPIGGSFVAASDGSFTSLSAPQIIAGGMSGNALTTRLANYDLDYQDGLGADFTASANILAAQATAVANPQIILADLLSVDLDARAVDPFNIRSSFSSVADGQEYKIPLELASLSVLLPETGTQSPSFGIGLSRNFDLGGSNLEIGVAAMREGTGVVGIKSNTGFDPMKSTHSAATFEWTTSLKKGQEFALSGSFGIAKPNNSSAATSLSSISYNSIKMTYAAQNLFGSGDRLAIGVGLPEAVSSGSATFALPQARSGGGTSFNSVDIPLAPSGRQLDLSISYGLPTSDNSEVIMSAVRSVNAGNIAGEVSNTAAIGWKYSF